MGKIYWFIGQPNSGKTTMAKRLQYWLQTDKRNWRKSVFHIDESDVKKIYQIDNKDRQSSYIFENTVFNLVKFLHNTNHDIVVSTPCPYVELRNSFKEQIDFREVYCYSKNRVTPKELIISDFEIPQQFHIELDTSFEPDESFKRLLKIIV